MGREVPLQAEFPDAPLIISTLDWVVPKAAHELF